MVKEGVFVPVRFNIVQLEFIYDKVYKGLHLREDMHLFWLRRQII